MTLLSNCPQPDPPAAEPPAPGLSLNGNVTIDNTAVVDAITALQATIDDGVEVTFASQVLDLRCQCMYDDQGDPLLDTPFVIVTKIECDNTGAVTSTTVGQFTDCDMATPYTPVGTPVDSCTYHESQPDNGQDIVGTDTHKRTVIGPATGWTIPFSVFVQSVTAIATAGDTTITDSDNATSTLFEFESNSWDTDNDVLIGLPAFDVPAGATLQVIWTEPVLQ